MGQAPVRQRALPAQPALAEMTGPLQAELRTHQFRQRQLHLVAAERTTGNQTPADNRCAGAVAGAG